MAVHVVRRVWMVGDKTAHRARAVGDGAWVVSYLRGRILNIEQAVAALQAAELVTDMDELAARVGLTSLEMFGLAVVEAPWDAVPAFDDR
ncbi:hypothetical protein FEK35_08570 [Nocardia cyriacigeorgica]|uniref:Uncharacterized protein n=1 Tax=Nocardia cyriacigeorgica TaxID=135487 RepID=A0A5R8PI26_9NOCA|nr:hypothetical protein [Nocardia cyriacigeorgica]TLG13834.1 hypothetical protein FEK35_08570 [Nocardia cyriacigeorgica]